MEDDDFGFCFSENSDNEEDEGPKNNVDTSPPEDEFKVNLLENRFVKEDIAILSSLCSDIVSQSGIIK